MTRPGCKIEGCSRPFYGKAMCRLHWKRVWRTGNPGGPDIEVTQKHCNVVGCERGHYSLGFCNLHWRRQHKWGHTGAIKSVWNPEERFALYTKLAETGCIEWLGTTDRDGYGYFSIGDKNRRAHRYAWERKHGQIPKGLCVCHKCDNRKCVNVEHLFLGTSQENTQDRHAKGRTVGLKGSRHANAKTTEVSVRGMRWLYSCGATYGELATIFGLTKQTIRGIVHREHWKHVQ